MKLLYNEIFLAHYTGTHPENARRLQAFGDLQSVSIMDGMPYLSLVHTSEYIEKVKSACQNGGQLDLDTIVSPDSFAAATQAVGATVMASETGDFALVRPPGHHAYPNRASGFCLFNSIAIAVQKLVQEGNKVLIFDFDGHLGDGTSHIFYETDQVFYCSIHQYPAFPGNGFVDEIGNGKGRGFTMNVPLPPGSGDDIFMDAVTICLSVMEQFQPDVVAVSAGFDAHQFDPLLDLRVSQTAYYKIGEELGKRFQRIFATLEGGYNIQVLPSCVANFIAGINGTAMPFPEQETSSSRRIFDNYQQRVEGLKSNLKTYWAF